jgi:hypothetical protein
LKKKRMREWRECGCLGKLHNIVVFIRRSPQRMEEFKAFQNGELSTVGHQLMVIGDNQTRWNSTFNLLKRALRLSDQVNFFVSRNRELAEDELSEEDWLDLHDLAGILEPFENLTLALEGHAEKGVGGSIGEVLPALDLLKIKLETLRAIFSGEGSIDAPDDSYGADDAEETDEPRPTPRFSPYLTNQIDNGLDHLEKYHAKLSRSPAYVAATILDPRCKCDHFSQLYSGQEVQSLKRMVTNLWKAEYRCQGGTEDTQSESASSVQSAKTRKPPNILLNFLLHRDPSQSKTPQAGNRRAGSSPPDELERWFAEPAEQVLDLVSYWKAKERTYPRLSVMALELLSIPAMSADAERVFSRYV